MHVEVFHLLLKQVTKEHIWWRGVIHIEMDKQPSQSIFLLLLEGLKIELELSASDTNIGILSCDRGQPIIEKVGGVVFKHVRCSDLGSV